MSMTVTEREGEILRRLLGKNENPTELVAKLHDLMLRVGPEVDDIIATAIREVQRRQQLASDDEEDKESVPTKARPWEFKETEDSPPEEVRSEPTVAYNVPKEDVIQDKSQEQFGTPRNQAEVIRRIDELIDQLVGPLGDAAKNNPMLVIELNHLLEKLGYKISALLRNTPSSNPCNAMSPKPPQRQQLADTDCDCEEFDTTSQIAVCMCSRGKAGTNPPREDLRSEPSQSQGGLSRPQRIIRGVATRRGRYYRSISRRPPAPIPSRVPGRRWRSTSQDHYVTEREPEMDESTSGGAIPSKCCTEEPCLKPTCKHKFCK